MRAVHVESLHGPHVMAKVLLAEHDAPLGHSVVHLLGKLAIVGDWVRSASELDAWAAKHRAHDPRLVLLDWELPGAAAGEPLGVLQGLLPSATIVVLSAALSGDDAAVLLSRGVPSINKPVHPFVLSMLALDLSTDAHGAASADVVPSMVPNQRFGTHVEGLSSSQKKAISREFLRPSPCLEAAEIREELRTRDTSDDNPPNGAEVGADALELRSGASFERLVAAYAASRRLSRQQALILDLYLNGKSDKEIAELCACSGATVYEHWRRMARKSGGRQKSDLIADFHRYLRHPPVRPAAVVTRHGPAGLPFGENLGLG